jgi:hypothetical protein
MEEEEEEEEEEEKKKKTLKTKLLVTLNLSTLLKL